MKSRSTPPLKLPRSPLILVLAQVKISPVIVIEEKIPLLQEALRKLGYPRFQERKFETTIRNPDGQNLQKDIKKQWEFLDKENHSSILVDSEGVTYQVTKYDVFESFMATMQGVLELFAKHVEPVLTQRIGLRYVDLVVPSEGREINSYFNTNLRGFKIHENDERKAFFSESVCQTSSASTFIHRYVEASSGFGFPPDLLPTNLAFPRDPRMKTPFGLLDLDHFMTVDAEFSIERVIADFFSLHDHQTKAFEASVTPAALEEWKQP